MSSFPAFSPTRVCCCHSLLLSACLPPFSLPCSNLLTLLFSLRVSAPAVPSTPVPFSNAVSHQTFWCLSIWKLKNMDFSSIFFFLINLLIYLFLAVLGLRLRARALPSRGKRGPLPTTVRGPPTIAASFVAEHRLQTRRPSSRGSRAQSPRGTWDPPRPGPEPASPAPAGRLPTTAPPGKPSVPF